MLLDRNLLQKEMFLPNYTEAPFQRIVSDAVSIMRHQAASKNIKILFLPTGSEIFAMIDIIRIQ